MRTSLFITAVIALLTLGGTAQAELGDWTKMDMPEAGANYTAARGIDGNNIIGGYYDASWISHNFLYNGVTWTTLDMSEAGNVDIWDIDGSNILGSCYLFNGSTWVMMKMPGAYGTQLFGIDGANIVGYYDDGSGHVHGCQYDGSVWTTLDMPGSTQSVLKGIDGSRIIGQYCDTSEKWHNFLYDGTNWTTLYEPEAWYETEVNDIDGSNIVGCYRDSSGNYHGFRFDGATWTTFDVPWAGAYNTTPLGIDGGNIVGYYNNASGAHGFIYTFPVTLSASVKLAGWKGNLSTLPVQVSVDGGTAFSVTLACTGDTGNFKIEIPPTGSHTVRVKAATYLAQTLTVVTNILHVSASFNLSPGDTNNDNVIDDYDFNTVITEFGGPPSHRFGWNSDVNGDDIVDDFDFNIIITNFGSQGDN